jgi:hypothetical protein
MSNVQLQMAPYTQLWALEAVWTLADEKNLSAFLLQFRPE